MGDRRAGFNRLYKECKERGFVKEFSGEKFITVEVVFLNGKVCLILFLVSFKGFR